MLVADVTGDGVGDGLLFGLPFGLLSGLLSLLSFPLLSSERNVWVKLIATRMEKEFDFG